MSKTEKRALAGRDEKGKFTTGNPGRPPNSKSWAETYNEILDCDHINIQLVGKDGVIKDMSIETKGGKNFRYIAGCAVVAEALKGNITAIREISNRTDGMPKQSIALEDNRAEVKVIPPQKEETGEEDVMDIA